MRVIIHKPNTSIHYRKAFSLVELSVVLVILGLVIGGIVSGQSLVRSSQMRAITADHANITTAITVFQDTYAATPGDFREATTFWPARDGADGFGEDCRSVPGTGLAACNGNGDGTLGMNLANTLLVAEGFYMWQHLANAGLIEGQYTGKGDPTVNAAVGDTSSATPGLNVPKSKMRHSLWGTARMCTKAVYPTCSLPAGVDFGQVLVFGKGPALYHSGPSPILRPTEMFNIDTKMDDGKAGAGKLTHHPQVSSAADCVTGTTAAYPDTALEYNLTNDKIVCALLYPWAFE